MLDISYYGGRCSAASIFFDLQGIRLRNDEQIAEQK